MTADALDRAIAEAKRFLERAAAAKSALKTNPYGVIEVSAVRRASMDLTRALAVLRKS